MSISIAPSVGDTTSATTFDPPLVLSEAEQTWLRQHPTIRLGVNPAYPPFDYFESDGTFAGMSADYIDLIAERLGIEMTIVPDLTWVQVFDAVKDGRVDVIVGVKNTVPRRDFLNFTADYLTFPLVIMTHDAHAMIAGLGDLRGRTLALPENYAITEEIAKRYPDIKRVLFPTLLDVLSAVERGDADATVLNLATASHLIAQNDIKGLVVAAPSGMEDARSAFGVRKDWPEMATILDKALASISPQEVAAIRERWIIAPYDARMAANRARSLAFQIAGGAAVAVLLVLLWIRQLKREAKRRRAAEEALAKQMSLHVALLENLPARVAYKDTEGRFIGCNRAYRAGVRRIQEQLVGKTISDIEAFPEEERHKQRALDIEALRTGKPVHREDQLTRSDGSLHDILLWRIPFALADGTPAGLLSITVDVSEQKAAERAVADQLAYQRALIDTIPSPIYIKDRNARFLGCNLAYERAFAVSRDALVGKTVHDLPHVPAERREAVYRRDMEILRSRGQEFHEEKLPFWDGPHDAMFWINSFALADGQVGGLVGAIVDVTQQKALERQAQEAERKLREIADSVPGVVYQLRVGADGQRSYTFMSDAVKTLRGYGREEVLADYRLIWAQVLDEDKPMIDAAIRSAAKSLKPLIEEYRIRMPDGTIKWLQSAAVPRRTEDGAVILNGYWVDVTGHRDMEIELAEAKAAADAASHAKSSFLAAMSHEIRTPMNGVLGTLELLGLTRLDSEQRANVEVMRDSGRALLRIVDDILDFSKIEAGMLDLRPEATALSDLVHGVRDVYSGAASGKKLLLTAETDAHVSPAVMVDPLRLRQILNNFVSNALKFTMQGSVAIEARLVDSKNGIDTVAFTVTDTGIGISSENQKKLFQPFTQAESNTTRRFGGTGLGLAICRRLADLMKGVITIDSAPGRGTTMRLVVPLPHADPSQIARHDEGEALNAAILETRPPAPTPEVAAAQGTLILVADDHPTNRMLLKRQINLLGYAVETVKDGQEALDAWQSGRFGLLVTDCNMPELDGYELARAIRAAERGNGSARIPILAYTANAMEGEGEICLAAGMDGYLAKPVEMSALLRALDRWLPLPPTTGAEARDAPRRAPMSPAAATGAGPIDRAKLSEISLGDEAVEREILADFRRTAEEDAASLANALETGNCGDITRISHRLKGACRSVGAIDLAAISEQMEKAGRAGDLSAIDAAKDPLFREVERLCRHLEHL